MNEAETQLWRQAESLPLTCDNPNFGVSNGKECAVDHILMGARPRIGEQSETIAELLKLWI